MSAHETDLFPRAETSPPRPVSRRVAATAAVAVGVLVAAVPVAEGATEPGSRCVHVGDACFRTVQAAVDAARDGDTVLVPAGRFRGGVVVTRSISIRGAGASRTSLVGGEHVLTVGTWQATTEPTVRISGMTLRRGRAHTSPESVDFTGKAGVFAGGGGLEIPAGKDVPGATVTVTDSVITDNRAIPTEVLGPTAEQEPTWPHCPDGFCILAASVGGGVESWGDLRLVRSRVTHNLSAGPLTSDADGGGIASWGDLTLRSSAVTNNRARAVAPHGRFAEGGGVFMSDKTRLTVVGSSVSRNVASLASRNPVTNPDGTTTDSLVNAGGIHVNDGSTVSVSGSHIDENTAAVDNPRGQAAVINSALQLTSSDLRMSHSTVDGNRAVARVKDIGDQGPLGTALQWCHLGTVDHVRVVANSSVIKAVAGDSGSAAAVFAGATMCQGFDPGPSRMSDSVVKGNVSVAVAHGGRADVFGAGMITASTLTMRKVVVSGNRGFARGDAGGEVQGGGIWNGAFPLPFLAGLHSNLTLERSVVTGNSLYGARGELFSGAGVYTRDPITSTATVVAGNNPDQCFGCSTATSSTATSAAAPPRRTPARAGLRPSTSALRDHVVATGLDHTS